MQNQNTINQHHESLQPAADPENILQSSNGEATQSGQTHALQLLENSLLTALRHYSNVHRGSGHFSKVSTHLYERAGEVVLGSLGLAKKNHAVLFLSPRRARMLSEKLKPGSFRLLSSRETGLALGVDALIVEKTALPQGPPAEQGGGTTRLYGPDWVLWAGLPDRFEAGTPAIINVIAFARALQLRQRFGKEVFRSGQPSALPPADNLASGVLSGLSGAELLEALRAGMPSKGITVPVRGGRKPFVNLDNAASTPAFGPAWEAFRHAMLLDEKAAATLAVEVRKICAGFLEAPERDFDIFFTSGTTESINLAAAGLVQSDTGDTEPVILTTVLEHSSNDLPWRNVPGHTLLRLNTDNNGLFDLNQLITLLEEYNEKGLHGRRRIRLVALSGASNVLGTCNDLVTISEVIHRHGALLMVDAAQLAAHREIRMQTTGIDLLALSAHKMYAPFGSGLLVARRGVLRFDESALKEIHASGEANPGGLAAMGKAMLLLKQVGFSLIEAEERKLTVKALNEISQIPEIRLYGSLSADKDEFPGRTGVIGFSVKSHMPATVARRLALSGGIGVRFGCHCAHLIIKQLSGFTPFQEKFQRLIVQLFPMLNLQGIVRVSFGIFNTGSDVDTLVAELKQITAKPGSQSSGKPLPRTEIPANVLSEKAVKKEVDAFVKETEQRVFGS